MYTSKNIYFTNSPVDQELDPGFGPDTEQRRVEFASKLEEETYNISLSNATRIARSYLIAALKIWGKGYLSQNVKTLSLRDIMIIWLIFDIVYIARTINIFNNDKVKLLLLSNKTLFKFFKSIDVISSKDIKHKYIVYDYEKLGIIYVREKLGGDMIFSNKIKCKNDIIKIYKTIHSKLPHSLRLKLLIQIIGVKLDSSIIRKLLEKQDKYVIKKLIKYICNEILKDKEYTKSIIKRNTFNNILLIISCFSKLSSKYFNEYINIE